MKLGCAVGAFTRDHYAPPYEEAVTRIAALGFQGVELIVASEADLTDYYTPARVKTLRRLMGDGGLALSELILYHPLVQGLSSIKPAARQRSYDLIGRGIECAQALGTNLINMVSNWPVETDALGPYLPSLIHPSASADGRFEPVLKVEFPRGFDAAGLWERYMESLAQVVGMMERSGVSLALEGHANVIAGSTDGLLRAFDRISSKSFGTNFDSSWHLLQREWLPWSVYRLGKRILHVHLRDGDGQLCYALPPGRGIIDWNGLLRALKDVGYDGFLSFEIGGYANPEPWLREAKQYVEGVMKEEGI